MIELIGAILTSAIRNLFDQQPDVLKDTSRTGMTEWNLGHHLANEIAKYIFWLNHDMDVMKRNHNNRRPDIIFHKRRINALNFIVIELKRRGISSDEDIRKIKEDWMGPELHYRFGASINISNKNKYEVIVFHEDKECKFDQTSKYLNLRVVSEVDQQLFITIVNQILSAKQKDPNAGTSSLERQIDEMVYKLYDLTDDEIAIVEREGIGGKEKIDNY